MEKAPRVDLERALRTGGEAGALIASYPWHEHPLGHLDEWSSRLRSAVSVMLSSPFPMHISWGAELFQLYNDAYRPVLGTSNHPAIGVPLAETFPEAMNDFILPRFDGPLKRGVSYQTADDLFPVNRHGWLEESHFAFAYNPLDDDAGVIRGVFTMCMETTAQVIAARRLELLTSLGAAVTHCTSIDQVFSAVTKELTSVPDVPVALVLAPEPTGCEIVAGAGFHPAATGARPTPSDLERLAAQGDRGMIPMAALGIEPLAHAAWAEPTELAWMLPIGELRLVVGLHPGLAFDDDYQRFLRLAADTVTAALARVGRLAEHEAHLAALQELDRAKDALISDISHELRTPLSLIGGAIEEIRHGQVTNDDDRELLWSIAERNVTRLHKLVNSLISFGQLEAGHLHAHLEAVELSRLTDESCESFALEFRRVSLAFEFDTADLSGQWFMVDPQLWETAVVNLLSNAHKYTLQGSVAAKLTSEDSGNVRFSVTDTGVGIDDSQFEELFERFARAANHSAGRAAEGAGIGLALVAAIAREHAGDVTVTSTLGKGSTFEMVVPLARSESSAVATTDVHEAGHGTTRRGPRTVLVVDDSEDILALAHLALSRHWEVHTARNGVEALEVVASAPVDCVVIDAMMPVMDGPTLITNLRSAVDTSTLPIVLLSGLNHPEGASGADLVLQKPVRFPDLIAAIEQLIWPLEHDQMNRR